MEWLQYRTCVNCNAVYQERSNLGKWECWTHVAGRNDDDRGKFHPRYTWDCCGYTNIIGKKTFRLLGCTPADHFDGKARKELLRLSKSALDVFDVGIYAEEGEFILIPRLDLTQKNNRLLTGFK